ncbi:MAG: FAD-dependent oxidoreductase [bacterium]|nr:FAD-dependent oxidoreductase [bacterium]
MEQIMSKKRIVVIGGVACGPKAASRIRRLDPEAEIILLEKGELLSYAGCGLPFYLSGEIKDYKELMCTPVGVVRDTHFFKAVKDITVYNRTVANKINRENKTVSALEIHTGKSIEVSYDKLILAVGGEPFSPPIEGLDLTGVNFLTTVEDARKIRDSEKSLKGKNAVIVGGGLIGVEVTESFVKQGMNVTLIEMKDKILPALLDEEMAFHVHNEMKNNTVNLMLGESLEKINGDDQGAVKSVTTSRGDIPADLVLIAIGTRPNVKLARDAGLEIGDTGAIRVDEFLRTSDENIYAGGDCVENTHLLTGKSIYAPLGSTANKHGRIIGDHICGRTSAFKGVLGTAICRVFNMNISRSGLSEEEAIKEGYDYVTVLSPAPDTAHFLSNAKPIIIKLVVDKKTRKLIGSQIVGPGDVAKRMEIAITAMSYGATVDEIANLDLAYAPPFSPAMDNIITAANIAGNKLNGISDSITPMDVKKKIDTGEDFILLDVRSPQEFDEIKIDDERVKLIPLGKLRERLEELPKDKEIITFCKISLRGYEAQLILEGAGFEKVKYMDGGIICWPYKKITKGA